MSINDQAAITPRPIPEIGRCVGCHRGARLDDGVCAVCLRPPRGRRWAELAGRVRSDPAFAVAVYRAIQSEAGRRAFVAMFGRPFDPSRVCDDESKVLELPR